MCDTLLLSRSYFCVYLAINSPIKECGVTSPNSTSSHSSFVFTFQFSSISIIHILVPPFIDYPSSSNPPSSHYIPSVPPITSTSPLSSNNPHPTSFSFSRAEVFFQYSGIVSRVNEIRITTQLDHAYTHHEFCQ